MQMRGNGAIGGAHILGQSTAPGASFKCEAICWGAKKLVQMGMKSGQHLAKKL